MAINLFDLIAMQQMGGGYGSFPNVQAINPSAPKTLNIPQIPSFPRTDLSRISPKFSKGNTGGLTGMMFAGNPLGMIGAGIGKLVGKGIEKYKSRKPEYKLGKSLENAVRVGLENKIARITRDNPGITPRDSVIAAAQELYASTAGSEQEPVVRDLVRKHAATILEQIGAFDPEAEAKFAGARKDLRSAAEGPDYGTIKTFITEDGEMISVPEKVAAAALTQGANLNLVDTPSAPKVGDTITAYEGDDRLTLVYDPTGEATGNTPNKAGWVIFRGDARAAAGGPESESRTDTQLGQAKSEYMGRLVGLDQLNYLIDETIKIVDEVEARGLPQATGTAGLINRFLGESATIFTTATRFAKSTFKGEKVFDDGKQSYSDLIDTSKYEESFSSFFKGAELSHRAKANLISLAFMLAITEEGSTRAISDKDIALRLETIGANVSRGETVKSILEDRRRQAFFSVKSRLSVDPHFGSTETDEGRHFATKLAEMEAKYIRAKEPSPHTPGTPPGRIRVTPQGTYIVP